MCSPPAAQEWHLDLTLFVLLLAAFAAANALSLAYIAAIGAGMALRPAAQHRLFSVAVVPLLGAAALFQYAVLLGPPPHLHAPALALGPDVKAPRWGGALCWACCEGVAGTSGAALHRTAHPRSYVPPQEWLGLSYVDPAALWLLLVAHGASVLLLHYERWARCAAQVPRGAEGEGLLPQPGSPNGAALRAALWQPLALEAQPRWRWQDWLRYWFYRRGRGPMVGRQQVEAAAGCGGGPGRVHAHADPWPSHPLPCPATRRHYLDGLLVAVVALCTLENDIVRQGLAALAAARRCTPCRQQLGLLAGSLGAATPALPPHPPGCRSTPPTWRSPWPSSVAALRCASAATGA